LIGNPHTARIVANTSKTKIQSFIEESEMTGTVKLDGWKPQSPPPENECRATIQLINEIMMGYKQMGKTEVLLFQIYLEYKVRVAKMKAMGTWTFPVRGKRTIDRMVNRAADKRWYPDGVPKLVAVTAGKYAINPKLFVEEGTEQ